MLFHVEHLPQRRWFYRWRIVGSYPPQYLVWREGESVESRVIIDPEIAHCEVQAEWRESDDLPWSKATLRESALGHASFRLHAKQDFEMPLGFTAFSVVAERMVSSYVFAPIFLAAGVEVEVSASADGPFLDNVLLAAGEFFSADARVDIRNVAPSLGSLVECSACDGVMRVMPGSRERHVFASQAAQPGVVAALSGMTSESKNEI